MHSKLWLSLLLFISGLVGCADSGNKCKKVLVLLPTETGDSAFQEVNLSTLNDPYALSGGAAKIYYENMLGGNGFTGKVAQPRYTRAGDVCVPMDAASSMAVSLYGQFERIMKFEAVNGTLDMLQWPRKVGLNIHVRSADGMTHNNAHYFGHGDAIAVLPYNLRDVPLALNPGVMGHEHFHGHFQRQVIDVINARLAPSFDFESLFYSAFNLAAAKPSVDDVEQGDLASPRGLNAFVLRAWNEGLADVYGAIFSNNPHFFDESLPALKESRSLDASLAHFMSSDTLEFEARKVVYPKDLVGISYQQGAYLARLMYLIARSGTEPPAQFLVRLMRRLKDVPPAIMNDYDTRVIGFEAILPLLLKDFPLNASNCSAITKSVSKELMKTRFTQCSVL